jgi:hypothetical protein
MSARRIKTNQDSYQTRLTVAMLADSARWVQRAKQHLQRGEIEMAQLCTGIAQEARRVNMAWGRHGVL